LGAVPWVEAILTLQEWDLGESVSTILQLILASLQGSSIHTTCDPSLSFETGT